MDFVSEHGLNPLWMSCFTRLNITILFFSISFAFQLKIVWSLSKTSWIVRLVLQSGDSVGARKVNLSDVVHLEGFLRDLTCIWIYSLWLDLILKQQCFALLEFFRDSEREVFFILCDLLCGNVIKIGKKFFCILFHCNLWNYFNLHINEDGGVHAFSLTLYPFPFLYIQTKDCFVSPHLSFYHCLPNMDSHFLILPSCSTPLKRSI